MLGSVFVLFEEMENETKMEELTRLVEAYNFNEEKREEEKHRAKKGLGIDVDLKNYNNRENHMEMLFGIFL